MKKQIFGLKNQQCTVIFKYNSDNQLNIITRTLIQKNLEEVIREYIRISNKECRKINST